jgi:hypothetical protein
MTHVSGQSYWWYAPIVVILCIGYAAGGALAFGVTFLGWLPVIGTADGRMVLAIFGMGMLGATMYATQWWARDMEEATHRPSVLPHCFDMFGYAMTIVGGGITGVVFFLALRLTSELVVSANELPPVRPATAYVVAFCGGLAQFKIQQKLMQLAVRWMQAVERATQDENKNGKKTET